MRVAWYRFAATFGRRRGGYVTLVLLIGLIGGIALGSVAAARRTQSSYTTFLAATNPSDLSLSGQGPNLTKKLAQLPGVQRVEAALYSLNAFPLTRRGPRSSLLRSAIARPFRSAASTASTSVKIGSRSRRAGWPARIERTNSSPPRKRLTCSAGTSARSSPWAFTPTPSRLRRSRCAGSA